MSFESLGLSAAVLRAVADQGYTQPTPIQSQVIPVVLEGRDVMAGAQTGTGKTAGFTLPLLQRLSAVTPAKGQRRVRALILTPTRELAAQVADSVRAYGCHLPLKSAVIFGGVSARTQVAELARGVDIVIATPGRLLDLASQRALDLSGVEVLVIDEADRMLDMGFLPDIKRVIALLPPKRQNLLFSATFPSDIRKLAAKLLDAPVEVEVARRNAAAEKVEQVVHLVDKSDKRAVLASLIKAHDWPQVLVFTRTKHGANRLARQLEQDGLSASAIHGNKSQAARTRALADFKRGAVRVLVATDIASRGLDIDELPHVVNFELPDVPEYYVHRIGRTGRAGHSGIAVSLVCADERTQLKAIERLLGGSISQQPIGVDVQRSPPPPREPARAQPSPRPAKAPRPGSAPKSGARNGPPGRSRAGRRRRAAAAAG